MTSKPKFLPLSNCTNLDDGRLVLGILGALPSYTGVPAWRSYRSGETSIHQYEFSSSLEYWASNTPCTNWEHCCPILGYQSPNSVTRYQTLSYAMKYLAQFVSSFCGRGRRNPLSSDCWCRSTRGPHRRASPEPVVLVLHLRRPHIHWFYFLQSVYFFSCSCLSPINKNSNKPFFPPVGTNIYDLMGARMG